MITKDQLTALSEVAESHGYDNEDQHPALAAVIARLRTDYAEAVCPEGMSDDERDALLQRARREYADGSDDCVEVDDDAAISAGDRGSWVQAWVWLGQEEE